MPSKNLAIPEQRGSTRRQTENVESFALQHRLSARNSEDGTKIIQGKFGHIYEYDLNLLGVMVMPDPPLKRYWGCARKTLLKAGFLFVQDGDGEGAATFDSNDPRQAKAAIRVAGIKRKRVVSNQRRDQLLASLRLAHQGHLAVQESLE